MNIRRNKHFKPEVSTSSLNDIIERISSQPNDVEQELRYQTRDLEGPTVILRFARSLNIQDLIDVMEVGVRLNIKMVLATDKANAQS
jgi:hypothetical protein